jgi:predicted NUDIX family NTP pyrophosphohydrolase
MEYLSGNTADHDHEVDEVGWFTFKEAEAKMTYPTERTILQKGTEQLMSDGGKASSEV